MEAAHVIPKKDLSSWQKWEPGTFDQLKNRQKTESQPPAPQTPEPVISPGKPAANTAKTIEQEAIVLPTAEQIERIYQQAQEEGKTAGYEEGKEQAAHETAKEMHQLQSLIQTFEQELMQIDQVIAKDLLALSIDLAKKITTQALQIKPELILPVVEEALRQLPSVSQHIKIMVHPDDAGRIRSHLKSQLPHMKCQIHEDAQIEPGGCRIESGGCEVDATLATRWQRILEPLDQNPDWLT
ncbi:flagellar assembly protein FliH [uncultured Nitrosomonas sp.]|uniref:flagellar assembly protein FliH n=1 Tax=uncultured Nitrosomonas sp. TaxID=156424 RepID=UPI0026054B33|nr:flagellar assembly protein FliH [uncultured Nitrosomonas sp.]